MRKHGGVSESGGVLQNIIASPKPRDPNHNLLLKLSFPLSCWQQELLVATALFLHGYFWKAPYLAVQALITRSLLLALHLRWVQGHFLAVWALLRHREPWEVSTVLDLLCCRLLSGSWGHFPWPLYSRTEDVQLRNLAFVPPEEIHTHWQHPPVTQQ